VSLDRRPDHSRSELVKGVCADDAPKPGAIQRAPGDGRQSGAAPVGGRGSARDPAGQSGVLILSSSSHAFDLAGTWATDANICPKIFQRKGKNVSFRPESEVYGSGFIVEGTSIEEGPQSANIKARRQEGEILFLIAACATDIMLSDVQFSLKIVSDNKVSRIFPGMAVVPLRPGQPRPLSAGPNDLLSHPPVSVQFLDLPAQHLYMIPITASDGHARY
jgi:hypothetical protein